MVPSRHSRGGARAIHAAKAVLVMAVATAAAAWALRPTQYSSMCFLAASSHHGRHWVAGVAPPTRPALTACSAQGEEDGDLKIMYGERQASRAFRPRIQQLLQLAARGDRQSMLAVGEAYMSGDRVEYSPRKAATYFLQAAEMGVAEAQYNLGSMLLSGDGVPADAAEGVRWISAAAEQGLPEAQYVLGSLLLAGEAGLSRDESAASGWLQAAVQQGYTEAEAQLGFALLAASRGDAEQERWAAHYLGQAAQGPEPDLQAQYELGRMLLKGRGVQKDAVTGASWISTAATAGFPDAQVLMAELLMKGEGVDANPEWAAYWLEQARANGAASPPA